jgi:RNA binding exosome subunit
MTETPQEFADRQYGEGYRNGKLEAIEHLIDLVQEDEMDYIFEAIRKRIDRELHKRYERQQKARWGR